jgi:hypothetical protein
LSISHIPPLAALSGLIVAVFGPIVALYLVFTRDQRRNIREIRRAAAARGWRYRVRRSQGNPWAFRLDGVTPGGFAWIFTSGNSGEGTHDWSTEATIKFPAPAANRTSPSCRAERSADCRSVTTTRDSSRPS